MLENMQRSSSLFQSKIQKAQTKTAAEAKLAEPPPQANDLADFSSEFTNQDASLNSDGKGDILKNWADILEDDDWLSEDEEEDEGEEGERPEPSEGRDQETESLDESTPEPEPAQIPPPSVPKSVSGGGFFNSAFGSPSTPPSAPTAKAAQSSPEVEKSLGYQWGPVAASQSKAPSQVAKGEAASEPPVPVVPPSSHVSATRRGGWEGLPVEESALATPRPRPIPKTFLPTRGQLQQVDRAVAAAAQLLIQTPAEEPGYEECVRLLSRFGLGALRMCGKAKVNVHILDEADFMGFPELAAMGLAPERVPVDGAYLVKSRTCLIDRRCLVEKPRYFHPALYYFAHALDHAQGGEEFSSRKAAAVLACFDASCNGHNGCDFVDELAAADPVRYFARSVSIYLGRDDCEEPIWSHHDLQDLDRSMHDYLEYLFGRFAA